jgi:hypothetical protein
MVLGLSQPLTEINNWSRAWRQEANNPAAICETIIYKIWDSRRLTTLWYSTACYRESFTFCMKSKHA